MNVNNYKEDKPINMIENFINNNIINNITNELVNIVTLFNIKSPLLCI